MALNEIEKKLYTKSEEKEKEILVEKPIAGEQKKTGWSDSGGEAADSGVTESVFSKIGISLKAVFWLLIAGVIVVSGISGFYIYQYFSVGREINFSVSGPSSVMLGQPFELAFNFDNNSKNILQDADFSILLPDGVSILGSDESKKIFSKKVSDIDPNSSIQEKVSMIITGQERSIKKINATFSYSTSLKTKFERKQEIEITAKESVIKLDLFAPEKILNGENFETKLHYANISDIDFSDIDLKFIFPNNFELKEVRPNDIKRTPDGNFNISSLRKGQEGDITFIGRAVGQEQSFFDLKAQISVSFSGQHYQINEKKISLNIASSPLSLVISLNNDFGYAAYPGDILRYKLAYINNTDVGLNDIVIKANLSGEMFDFSSLKTTGSFDSRANKLTWNASNMPQLRSLQPKESGAVEFEAAIKQDYPIKRLSDKNFILKINGEISSPTVPYYVASEKTIGIASLDIKIGGKAEIEPAIYFADYSLGVSNRGSLPPKVNKPINFTIHLVVKNYSNDIKDIEISSLLAPGVRFTGVKKSNIETSPIYNERTQGISWLIPKIYATKGIIGKPIEAIFQVEALPNITQVGQSLPILGQTVLEATDEFTGAPINAIADALDTKYLKDSSIDIKSTQVIQ